MWPHVSQIHSRWQCGWWRGTTGMFTTLLGGNQLRRTDRQLLQSDHPETNRFYFNSLYSGGDGLGNAYFFIKRANFLTERLHCFDSFKSWVRVMVKWGNGIFGNFLVQHWFIGGNLKKISKKPGLSLNYCSGHNFGPTECCKSLHRSFMDAWLNADFNFVWKK